MCGQVPIMLNLILQYATKADTGDLKKYFYILLYATNFGTWILLIYVHEIALIISLSRVW